MGSTLGSDAPDDEAAALVPSVTRRFHVERTPNNIVGHGSASVCYRCRDAKTGQPASVKVYRSGAAGCDVALRKFLRQVDVLRTLRRPLEPPAERSLWHRLLWEAEPSDFFVRIFDYSRGLDGEPGPDPRDNELYVVMELAQETLRDYINRRRRQKRQLPRDTVRGVARALVLTIAALHSRGFVHLDVKPENLMLCGDRLKLIDVDGCVSAGSTLTMLDASISFSLSYCAPEWARFLTKEAGQIEIAHQLDVWSVGLTICELITLEPVMYQQFNKFQAKGAAWAGWKCPRWLGSLESHPCPDVVQLHDPDLYELVSEWMLAPDPAHRRYLAECLSHPYLASGDAKTDGGVPVLWTPQGEPPEKIERRRGGKKSHENLEPRYTGSGDLRHYAAPRRVDGPAPEAALREPDSKGEPEDAGDWKPLARSRPEQPHGPRFNVQAEDFDWHLDSDRLSPSTARREPPAHRAPSPRFGGACCAGRHESFMGS